MRTRRRHWGSIAGLTAARVLSDFCDRVTIFERDDLPRAPANRVPSPALVVWAVRHNLRLWFAQRRQRAQVNRDRAPCLLLTWCMSAVFGVSLADTASE